MITVKASTLGKRQCCTSLTQCMVLAVIFLIGVLYFSRNFLPTYSESLPNIYPSVGVTVNDNLTFQRKDQDSTVSFTHAQDEKCIKRLPQAIIIGIQKCGTTTILSFLSDHPQIAACLDPGETKYFSMHFRRPLSWYKNLMPCSYSNQITMEKSPPYFYRRYCAVGIRKMNPNTKIIITVKEPIERAISMYAMLKEKRKKMPLFEDYIMSNNRTKGKAKSIMVGFSNYPKHMKYWLDNFKMEQILILDGHKFLRDPSSELIKVEQFLDIGSYFTAERFVFEKKKGKFCIIKSGKTECMGSKKGRPHPSIDENVRLKLQEYFKPLNEKFFNMIGRRFDWGY